MSSSLGPTPVILLTALQDRPGGDEGATRPMIGPTLVSKTPYLELARSRLPRPLAGLLPSRAVDSPGWRSQRATVAQYLSNPLLDCLSPKPDRSADLYVGNLW